MSVSVDADVEAKVKQILVDHFRAIYGPERVGPHVDSLLGTAGHEARFAYVRSVVGEASFDRLSRILISGMAAGSELIVALAHGFIDVHGVEVDQAVVDACALRLGRFPNAHPIYYDGYRLPYVNGFFDMVISSHIIEHTQDPALYVAELMRVLRDEGVLFIEFPSRFHHTELHTGLVSFEWLPSPLRNTVLRMASSRWSPLRQDVKLRYYAIRRDLRQISTHGVRRMIRRSGYPYATLAARKVSPGIDQLVIQCRPAATSPAPRRLS